MQIDDLLMPAVVLLVMISLLRYQLSAAKRRRQDNKEQSVATHTKAIVTAREHDQREVELYEHFREMNAKLDTKIHILNELILEADTTIKRLQQLQISTGTAVSQPEETTSNEEPTVVEPAVETDAEVAGKEASPAQEPLIIDVDQTPAAAPASSQKLELPFAEIYRLADRGLSAVDISERVGKPVGEVDLILSLRRRRQQSDRSF